MAGMGQSCQALNSFKSWPMVLGMSVVDMFKLTAVIASVVNAAGALLAFWGSPKKEPQEPGARWRWFADRFKLVAAMSAALAANLLWLFPERAFYGY